MISEALARQLERCRAQLAALVRAIRFEQRVNDKTLNSDLLEGQAKKAERLLTAIKWYEQQCN